MAQTTDETPPVVGPPKTFAARVLRRARGGLATNSSDDDAFVRQSGQSTSSSESLSVDDEEVKHGTRRESSRPDDLAKFYAPIDDYEGRHRFDPTAEWTEGEEKRLIRRLDYKICSWACVMFFALQLDRGNINQALSETFLEDLNLNTNNYNYGQTIFYVSFLLAELPSQLISKKLGPDNWIPIQMISWSIVACCQSRLTGVTSFYVTRCLLGVIEGGFIPDVILYLSYFYKSKELPIRLSFFWGAYILTFIISAFLATGILRLRGYLGWSGWQWLFALEGALTALIGLISWVYLPPSPTQTASRFRGKDGWFSEREEIIMVNRIIRDDPGKGDMHNRQAVTPKRLWRAFKDYDLWPIYLLGLTWLIPSSPMTSYLTLILRGLKFDTFETNLLTIPAYILFLANLIFWTWLSEKVNNRFLMVVMGQIWTFPLLLALEVLPEDKSQWARYALSIMVVGHPYVHAIIGK
ncbi:MAG: hypothetical protein M1837_001913 [Sclerophora amabilis]|nr:MAG: hypothetical protein M1837_001913 [Sclerophora amabilis]